MSHGFVGGDVISVARKVQSTKRVARATKKVARGKVAGAKASAAKKTGTTAGRGKKKVAAKKARQVSAGGKRKKVASKTKNATGKRPTSKKVAGKKTAGKKTAVATASAKRRKKKSVKKSVKKAVAKKVVRKSTAKKSVLSSRGSAAKKTSRNSLGSKKANPTASRAKKRLVGIFARSNPRSATSQDPIQFPEESRKIPKTHLSRKELREFRELLLRKRSELAGDVRHMSRPNNSSGRGFGEKPAMPIHMADVGTDNFEHEFTLGLIENEQGRIRQIDESLERIAARTYGVCVATFKPISHARLRAKPWAKFCIEYARAREEGRVR